MTFHSIWGFSAKTLHIFVVQLMIELFSSEFKRLQRTLDNLIDQNNIDKPDSAKCPMFLYNGHYYVRSGSPVSLNFQLGNSLSRHLTEKMQTYLGDKKTIEEHEAQIKQVLTTLLINANTKQEARDSLPECLVSLVPEYQNMPRYLQPLSLIRGGDKYTVKQYHKVLPLIEMYAGLRLLY